MKRDIYNQLLSWKQSSSRKPLVLKGARQVGKTYVLKLWRCFSSCRRHGVSMKHLTGRITAPVNAPAL